MNYIDLGLIGPSPHPIRKSWDEQKMQELVASIEEQGVVVPIKIRPTNGIKPCPGKSDLYGGDCVYHEFNILTGAGASSHECHYCSELWNNVYVDPDGEYSEPEVDENGYNIPFVIPFETVYGHRRVEAAKQAGLKEIPAIIEGIKDDGIVWEALIENLSIEDMSAYDRGEEIENLKQAGFSIREQARRIGVARGDLSRWHDNYLERVSGLALINANSEMIEQVQQVKRAMQNDLPAKQEVINKAIAENLDRFETRAVADAYIAANKFPNAESVQKEIISSDTAAKGRTADEILGVARINAGIEERQEHTRQALANEEVKNHREAYQQKEQDPLVANYLSMIKQLSAAIDTVIGSIEYGKFSQESAPFTIRKNNQLISKLQELNKGLGDV